MMISRDWCVRQMKSCYWRVVMLQSLMMNTVHKYSAKHYKWSQWYFTEHIIYVKKGYCIFITLNEVNWMKFLKKEKECHRECRSEKVKSVLDWSCDTLEEREGTQVNEDSFEPRLGKEMCFPPATVRMLLDFWHPKL